VPDYHRPAFNAVNLEREIIRHRRPTVHDGLPVPTERERLLQMEWAKLNGQASSAKGKYRRMQMNGATLVELDDARRQWMRYAKRALDAECAWLAAKDQEDTR
jgi:hypothetical protein